MQVVGDVSTGSGMAGQFWFSPFPWHPIWFSTCQDKSFPVWIISYRSTLMTWSKIFDLKTKQVLELYGIIQNLRSVNYDPFPRRVLVSEGPAEPAAQLQLGIWERRAIIHSLRGEHPSALSAFTPSPVTHSCLPLSFAILAHILRRFSSS